ncbi:nucleoside-diphosphate-sugar epimerase [Palleronia aestuarii]|uniref:Nucleoside-diphosphate-sugar epimerase n=1 Tax=Palleronia aestuarii TaxID=568105 RepID=A0A2W7N592_9RHOB|nr:D-erythronate dehydrogenase [Palleronia aestuarii]PZX15230.1 nucleoside-diphosphate-sugar epimerase [Palleronia aestuarii]
MHVMITGAGGMIGRKFAESIANDDRIGDRTVETLTLVDIVPPDVATDFTGTRNVVEADLSNEGVAADLVARQPDVLVHLAAIVSGEAEADLEKGYRINLDGTRALLDAIRAAHETDGYTPRVVYASSLAVFGAPFPDKIGDDFFLTPLTSYGTQKAMGELLLDDYSRRGFLDGVGIRFPTICIRPGKPNKAASGFFSGILREPLEGKEAVLPVDDDVRHYHASPRSAVGFLRHAAALDTQMLGSRRNMTMPGVSATVADQIEALRNVAGDETVALIRREPDPTIEKIVSGWPRDFDVRRAREAGFTAEDSFEEIIRVYIEDEMEGRAPRA